MSARDPDTILAAARTGIDAVVAEVDAADPGLRPRAHAGRSTTSCGISRRSPGPTCSGPGRRSADGSPACGWATTWPATTTHAATPATRRPPGARPPVRGAGHRPRAAGPGDLGACRCWRRPTTSRSTWASTPASPPSSGTSTPGTWLARAGATTSPTTWPWTSLVRVWDDTLGAADRGRARPPDRRRLGRTARGDGTDAVTVVERMLARVRAHQPRTRPAHGRLPRGDGARARPARTTRTSS